MRSSIYSLNTDFHERGDHVKAIPPEELDSETFFEKFEMFFSVNLKKTAITEPVLPRPPSNRRSGKISSRKSNQGESKKTSSNSFHENKENIPLNLQSKSQFESTYSQNLKKLMRQTSKEFFQPEKKNSKANLNLLYEMAKKKSPKTREVKPSSSKKKIKNCSSINQKMEAQIMKSISNLQEKCINPRASFSSKASFFESARDKLAQKIAKVKEAKRAHETSRNAQKFINAGSSFLENLKGKKELTKNRSVSSFNMTTSHFSRKEVKPPSKAPEKKEVRTQRSTTFNTKSFR